jgi:predicted transcriptional regulator
MREIFCPFYNGQCRVVYRMKEHYLTKKITPEKPPVNIFTNRSAVLLHELLIRPPEEFRIRNLARQLSLSHGLVQRIITQLVEFGIVESKGVRTAKKYNLVRPGKLLLDWISAYSITNKCTFYNYSSGYSCEEIEKILKRKTKDSSYTLALHYATRIYDFSFTNLSTIELYFNSENERIGLEKKLYLEPEERSYDVLLIKPYYRSILHQTSSKISGYLTASPLLTFLDLYHFPLRGHEQAEYLLKKHPALTHLKKALQQEMNEQRKT